MKLIMEGWRQFVNEGYPNDDAQTPVDNGYENYQLASSAKLTIDAFTDRNGLLRPTQI